ncbi:DUF4344 domain-containing metallopeptidase [Streptomyces yangpuensis]|uniref:DUF4344 domain-containing metallopeptidase n=1 Tax=Streptomyces yangpuensis TaxID=1648182 RepID=UPI0036280AAD
MPTAATHNGIRRTPGEPAPADRAGAAVLKQHRIAETVTADLNAYLDLPHRIEVVARSCAGEGSGYDPAAHRIELCYDDLTEDHALIDTLGLPVPGDRAEEDAADRFAQLMLLREGRPDGERTLLTAARGYDLAAAAHPEPDPDDEHAPDPARAESHRCATYGAAPTRNPDLATPLRTHCPHTWPRTRDAWTRDLAPFLRR